MYIIDLGMYIIEHGLKYMMLPKIDFVVAIRKTIFYTNNFEKVFNTDLSLVSILHTFLIKKMILFCHLKNNFFEAFWPASFLFFAINAKF